MDPRRGALWAGVAIVSVGWCAGMAQLLQASYDTAMGVALFHLVGGVGAVVTWLVARRTEAPRIVHIVVAGWFAKVLGTLARFYVLQGVYDGSGDATRYSQVGAEVAEMLRSGQVDWHHPGGQVVGTHFVEFVTGLVFTVTGPTSLGGFMVFSALGFVGTFLIFRAVRIAAPEVDARLFALLIFFLPSMVFWPSSIGKETLMLFAIGLFTYGAARMFARSGRGLVAIAAGTGLSAMVRPHITLMLVAALLLATVIVHSPRAADEIPLGKILRVGIAAGLLVWAAVAAGSFLDVDPLDRGAVGQALESTSEQTDEGDSVFSRVSPVLYPVAVVTVLFRPFPFEASNVQILITSCEGMALLVMVVLRRREIWQGLRRLRVSPLLAFALVFTGVFIYAYTGITNFGVLARQRVQVYPFVAIVLAVVRPGERKSSPHAVAAPVITGPIDVAVDDARVAARASSPEK